jgi:glycine dehydrogenase subunit 1
MACLGGSGMRELARLNYDRSEYLKARLRQADVGLPFAAQTFNEFVAVFPPGFRETYRRLIERKIVAGLPLEPYYPELADHYLFGVTETMPREDLDTLVREVQS